MELLKGYITVPNDIPDERVWNDRQKFLRQYEDSFEKEGWKLLSRVVSFAKCSIPLTEDIKQGLSRWVIMGYWERAPVTQTFEVDEKLMPKLMATGKFKEK